MANNVGERYATALLEVTEERKETTAAAEALDALAKAISSNEQLEQVMLDPRMKNERVAVFTSLAEKVKAPATVTSLMRALDEAERLSDLPSVAASFRRLADQKAGRVRGSVTSAAELGDAEKKQLADALAQIAGKEVAIDYHTDASLIGGVVVKVQDLVWDGSVKAQLERMRQTLRT